MVQAIRLPICGKGTTFSQPLPAVMGLTSRAYSINDNKSLHTIVWLFLCPALCQGVAKHLFYFPAAVCRALPKAEHELTHWSTHAWLGRPRGPLHGRGGRGTQLEALAELHPPTLPCHEDGLRELPAFGKPKHFVKEAVTQTAALVQFGAALLPFFSSHTAPVPQNQC